MRGLWRGARNGWIVPLPRLFDLGLVDFRCALARRIR